MDRFPFPPQNVIPLAQARPVEVLREGYYEGPDYTDAGVVCAGCSQHYTGQVRHASVEHVRYCFALAAEMEAEAAAEHAAERAVERYFEERGGAEYDPRERELWALEDLLRGL
jgi:hypothetical protein